MIHPTKHDIGKRVKYNPNPGPEYVLKGGGNFNPPTEFGIIKSFNDKYIFVCFEKPDGDWTGAMACYPENLNWTDSDLFRLHPRDLFILAEADLIASKRRKRDAEKFGLSD